MKKWIAWKHQLYRGHLYDGGEIGCFCKGLPGCERRSINSIRKVFEGAVN